MGSAQVSVLPQPGATGQPPALTGPAVDALLREAGELEYQALVNERSYFEAAEYWKTVHLFIGSAVALLGALAARGLADYFGDPLPSSVNGLTPDSHTMGMGLLGLVLAVLTAASNFLNPKGQQDMHLATAKRYSAFRTEVRQFRVLGVRNGIPVEPTVERLGRLAQRHGEIHAAAPSVSDRCHKKAKRKLSSNVHFRELRPLTGHSAPAAEQAAANDASLDRKSAGRR